MIKPAIIAVGYNRPDCLARLLGSIGKANYKENDITLVISLDLSDKTEEVKRVAEDFDWKHGEKVIRCFKERQGLRPHILQCGDLSEKYGAVIVLEDDLFVSPEFYNYAAAAASFVDSDDRIGGVSLYNHTIVPYTREAFSPIEDGFDNWYFQFASSWGQLWTENQWKSFRKWYSENGDKSLEGNDIPKQVSAWSSSSWLKYYIKYLIVTDRYFLYPKISLSTNFGSAGTHVGKSDCVYQVPLCAERGGEYKFSTLDESVAVYDAFFENTKLWERLGTQYKDICIDLYGEKPVCDKKYFLTRKPLKYKIIKSFACEMHPIEQNIIYGIEGKSLFLYDTAFASDTVPEHNKIPIEFLHRNLTRDREIRIAKHLIAGLWESVLSHLHLIK